MSRFGQVKAHTPAARERERERDAHTPTLFQFPIHCKCDYSVAAHFLDISNYIRFLPLMVFIEHLNNLYSGAPHCIQILDQNSYSTCFN